MHKQEVKTNPAYGAEGFFGAVSDLDNVCRKHHPHHLRAFWWSELKLQCLEGIICNKPTIWQDLSLRPAL